MSIAKKITLTFNFIFKTKSLFYDDNLCIKFNFIATS